MMICSFVPIISNEQSIKIITLKQTYSARVSDDDMQHFASYTIITLHSIMKNHSLITRIKLNCMHISNVVTTTLYVLRDSVERLTFANDRHNTRCHRKMKILAISNA